MDNMLSVIKNKRSSFAKIISLVMLFFGNSVFLSFATDSYATFSNGFYSAGIDMTMRNGRPIIGLIYELHYLSGLSNVSFYYISSAVALLLLGLAIWIYQEIIGNYGVKENTRILLAFAGIANTFIIEYFLYIEKCGFMLAVLFNVMGVYWIEKYFKKRKFCYFGLTVLAMTLAIFTYQGTVALFVILSIPFAMRNAENFKKYILNGLAIGTAYFIPVMGDFGAFKFVFKSSKIVEKTDAVANLKSVIMEIYFHGISTFDILPHFLYLIVSLVIFAVIIIGTMSCQKRLWNFFNALVIVFAASVFSTATIIQGTGWWTPRVVYPIASIAAALAIDLFINREEVSADEVLKKIDSQNYQSVMQIRSFQKPIFLCGGGIALAAITVLLIVQYFSFNKIYIDKYRLNELDRSRYLYIYQEICNYQESTGIKVTKIAFYQDADVSWSQYSDLYEVGDGLVSAFLTEWSNIRAMNYYLQTNYEKINPVAKYTAYFAERNWSYLSHEQLIFDEDTLHICVY